VFHRGIGPELYPFYDTACSVLEGEAVLNVTRNDIGGFCSEMPVIHLDNDENTHKEDAPGSDYQIVPLH